MPAILRLTTTLLTALALTGCASVLLVDNQVESFPRWTDRAPNTTAVPAAPQIYRFDRLPSQQDERAVRDQDELERYAEASLARRGWTRAAPGVAAPWTVQVSASTVRLPRAPWDDPWGTYAPPFALAGRDYVVTGKGQVIFFPVFPRMESPYYQRAVSLVIRDSASGRVVFETRAAHDGRWNSTPALWTAMFDGALQGFPTPPGGVRQVNIEVPR